MAMIKAIIEMRCMLETVAGGALAADLIFGRLAEDSMDNHLDFFVESSSSSSVLLPIGDVGSDGMPAVLPKSFSSENTGSDLYECSPSSSPSPISLNTDLRPLEILLTMEKDVEPSLRRSAVSLESNLGRVLKGSEMKLVLGTLLKLMFAGKSTLTRQSLGRHS